MALPAPFSLDSKIPTQMVDGLLGDKDSLAPFQGANAIPCPLAMDIEFSTTVIFIALLGFEL
jgi:hypothetical protein